MRNTRKAALMVAVTIVIAAVFSGASFAFETTTGVSAIGNKDPGKYETAVGSLVADALRSLLKTDIALVAASEVKSLDKSLPAGKITSDDIAAFISYPDDPLAILMLDGKSVRQAMERAVSIYPQPNLGFLQVSGLSFTFDPKKSVGQRITNITSGGAQLDDAKTYSIAMTNSMANGALGYWKVWSTDKIRTRFADTNLIKAVESYFAANPNINYERLDRIATVN